MRHKGGGGGRHCYWGKPLSVILSDSIIWWQCMEKRWQCIKVHLVTEHGVYVDMNKVEVILKVGRCGVESETEGGVVE